MDNFNVKIIGHIENNLTEKFGTPRQSGLACTYSKIVFNKEYQIPEAFRGLEEFSHLWILWFFNNATKDRWSPTVRPPILGGNKRMGVFATRSPYRPNSIGMSSVKIKELRLDGENGPEIIVEGADLMNGTPIVDIKPYLAYTDSHTDSVDGFTSYTTKQTLDVVIPNDLQQLFPNNKLQELKEILALDPRPAYQNDENRIYKMAYGNFQIHFKVQSSTLTVVDII